MIKQRETAAFVAFLLLISVPLLLEVTATAGRTGCVCRSTIPAFAGRGTTWNTTAKDGGQIACRLEPTTGDVQFLDGRTWREATCGGFPWLGLLLLVAAAVVVIAILGRG